MKGRYHENRPFWKASWFGETGDQILGKEGARVVRTEEGRATAIVASVWGRSDPGTVFNKDDAVYLMNGTMSNGMIQSPPGAQEVLRRLQIPGPWIKSW